MNPISSDCYIVCAAVCGSMTLSKDICNIYTVLAQCDVSSCDTVNLTQTVTDQFTYTFVLYNVTVPSIIPQPSAIRIVCFFIIIINLFQPCNALWYTVCWYVQYVYTSRHTTLNTHIRFTAIGVGFLFFFLWHTKFFHRVLSAWTDFFCERSRDTYAAKFNTEMAWMIFCKTESEFQ